MKLEDINQIEEGLWLLGLAIKVDKGVHGPRACVASIIEDALNLLHPHLHSLAEASLTGVEASKSKYTPEERQRRSQRMKQLWAEGKMKKQAKCE